MEVKNGRVGNQSWEAIGRLPSLDVLEWQEPVS